MSDITVKVQMIVIHVCILFKRHLLQTENVPVVDLPFGMFWQTDPREQSGV